MASQYITKLIVTFFISYVVTLVVELPFGRLYKEFIMGRSTRPVSQESVRLRTLGQEGLLEDTDYSRMSDDKSFDKTHEDTGYDGPTPLYMRPFSTPE